MRNALRKEAFPIDVTFAPMPNRSFAFSASSLSQPSISSPSKSSDEEEDGPSKDQKGNDLIIHRPVAVRKGNEWHVRVYEILKMVVDVRNECCKFFFWFPSITVFNPCSASAPTDVLPCLLMKSLGPKASPKSLSMSVTTVPPTPSEMALFEGKQTNNFLGTLSATTVLSQPTAAAVPPPSKHLSSTLSSATDTSSLSNSTLTTNVVDDDSDENPITMREIGSKSLGVCFVAEGTFDILVEVVEVSEFGLALPLLEKNITKKVVRVVVEGEED